MNLYVPAGRVFGVDSVLVAYSAMLEEIRDFRSLARPGPEQKAMVDLLEVIEGGGTLGLDAHVVIEELVAVYKKWKYGFDGRYDEWSRSGRKGPMPTWPFLDELPDSSPDSADLRDASAARHQRRIEESVEEDDAHAEEPVLVRRITWPREK